jgi:hypothetical protein
MISIPLPNYSVDFGNQITIGCSVSSNPPHTRVFWRKKRNGITTDLFNNISVTSWQSVLLVKETGVPGENNRPVASH